VLLKTVVQELACRREDRETAKASICRVLSIDEAHPLHDDLSHYLSAVCFKHDRHCQQDPDRLSTWEGSKQFLGENDEHLLRLSKLY